MKKLPISFLVVLSLPALTFAAQVFGSLRYNGASVGPNVEVFVHCPNRMDKDQKPDAKTTTDRSGSYRMYLRGSVKCELRIVYNGRESDKHYIYSDKTDPVRYDFELIDGKSGWLLRRR